MGLFGFPSDLQGALNAACNLRSDARGDLAELKIFYSSTPSINNSNNGHSERYIIDKVFIFLFDINALVVRPV